MIGSKYRGKNFGHLYIIEDIAGPYVVYRREENNLLLAMTQAQFVKYFEEVTE